MTGVASVERISSGRVREAYYRKRKGGPIAVVHIVWDLQAWSCRRPLSEQAQDIVNRTLPPYGPLSDRRQERH